MWQRVCKILLMLTIWAGVIAYIAWASVRVQRHIEAQTVKRVDIAIVDSTNTDRLISSQRVREWLRTEGYATIGEPIEAVDVTGIRNMIARNGFVDEVDVYTSYKGVLHIDISQRQPLLRVLLDGYNVYVTRQGFVFSTPEASSLYAPVVTGDYRPLFSPEYEGLLSDYMETLREESEAKVKEMSKEKRPLYDKADTLAKLHSEKRKQKVKAESDESPREFRERKELFMETKQRRLLEIEREQRKVQAAIDAVTARQSAEQQRMARVEKRYTDFCRLIEFVDELQRNDFWRAEVVQICASKTSYGAMDLTIIPRSGDFCVRLGEPVALDDKLERLMRFYRSGLSRLGWNNWSKIDLRYNNQVVCTQ